MAQTFIGTHSEDDGLPMTGQETVQTISEEARERAQEEFADLGPGGSDPLHFGTGGATTQTNEDPISEVNPFQESLP